MLPHGDNYGLDHLRPSDTFFPADWRPDFLTSTDPRPRLPRPERTATEEPPDALGNEPHRDDDECSQDHEPDGTEGCHQLADIGQEDPSHDGPVDRRRTPNQNHAQEERCQGEAKDFGGCHKEVMHVNGPRRAGEDRTAEECQKALASEWYTTADGVLLEVPQGDKTEAEIGTDHPAQKDRRRNQEDTDQIKVG